MKLVALKSSAFFANAAIPGRELLYASRIRGFAFSGVFSNSV